MLRLPAYWYLILLCLVLPSAELLAYSDGQSLPSRIDLSAVADTVNITSSITLYVDEPPFNYSDVVIDKKFSPYTSQNFHDNPTVKANKRYWLKISLNNSSHRVQNGKLYFGLFDRLHAYTIENKTLHDSTKIGGAYKSKATELNTNPYLLPIAIQPSNNLDLLIQLSTSNHMINVMKEIDVIYIPQSFSGFIQTHHENALGKGLWTIGILFVIGFLLIVCLILFFLNKEMKALGFAFLCLTTLCYYLRDLEEYFHEPIFFAHWDELVPRTEVLFRGLITISFLVFTLIFFDFGKWRKVITGTSLFVGGVSFFTGLWLFFKIDPLQHFTIFDGYLYLAEIVISVINSSFILFLLWKSKERYSKLYLIGTLSYLLISYSGLFLNVRFPKLTQTFFSSNLLSLNGILLFLLIMAYIIVVDLYYAKQHLNKESIRAENLEYVNKTKSKLFTNIAHELRTPLTIITGLSRKLKGNEKSKKLIINNSEDLLHLINQMLDLSKIEAGMVQIEKNKFELISYLKVLVDAHRPMANDRFISLNFYSKQPSLYVEQDKEKLKHVLGNLISNAIKYTPEYGSVLLTCELRNDLLEIEISDTGIGIAKADMEKVFSRYYQIDEESQWGSGVGLSIVKELVQLMNGEIKIKSTIDEGSTFTLSLPHKGVERPKPSEIHNPTPVHRDVLEHVHPEGLLQSFSNKKSILVIEDNQDLMYYIESLLKTEYTLHKAFSGDLGLAKAKKDIPDIVITDVMMPKMSGIAVCKSLKSTIETSHIPIIMLTAKADKLSKIEGLQAGADAYLTKPFHEEELYLIIQNLILAQEKYRNQYQNLKEPQNDNSKNNFIIEIEKLIQTNLHDQNFAMQDLCQMAHLERSQLYRKVKALTGFTPAQLIKKMRLAKAHQMLSFKEGSVSEISYKSGFRDVSYFSKLFKEAYGKSPGQFL